MGFPQPKPRLAPSGTLFISSSLYPIFLLMSSAVFVPPQQDFLAWGDVLAPQWRKLATLLFLVSMYFHAWIGVRNIFMDYVKSGGLRLALYTLAIAWLVVCAGWSVQILWSV